MHCNSWLLQIRWWTAFASAAELHQGGGGVHVIGPWLFEKSLELVLLAFDKVGTLWSIG